MNECIRNPIPEIQYRHCLNKIVVKHTFLNYTKLHLLQIIMKPCILNHEMFIVSQAQTPPQPTGGAGGHKCYKTF